MISRHQCEAVLAFQVLPRELQMFVRAGNSWTQNDFLRWIVCRNEPGLFLQTHVHNLGSAKVESCALSSLFVEIILSEHTMTANVWQNNATVLWTYKSHSSEQNCWARYFIHWFFLPATLLPLLAAGTRIRLTLNFNSFSFYNLEWNWFRFLLQFVSFNKSHD